MNNWFALVVGDGGFYLLSIPAFEWQRLFVGCASDPTYMLRRKKSDS